MAVPALTGRDDERALCVAHWAGAAKAFAIRLQVVDAKHADNLCEGDVPLEFYKINASHYSSPQKIKTDVSIPFLLYTNLRRAGELGITAG